MGSFTRTELDINGLKVG